jgi:formylglycine-generating enzyme required for sulfatase activity
VSDRYNCQPDLSFTFFGFRIVKAVETKTHNIPLPEMVFVEGGTFMMGATEEQVEDAYKSEKPAHQVTLDSFEIGKYEVTQAQWQAVMSHNPSHFKNHPEYPVEQVSWYDVQEFIQKLNSITGKTYRLPTEAEWEYAARGGNKSRGYKYAGTTNDLDAYAWYDGNSGDKSHPVGQKSPNELGIYDMSGNIWEWCQDYYDADYYKSSPTKNPLNSKKSSYNVFRGGSWNINSQLCRVAYRSYLIPNFRSYIVGFRLVRSLRT